MNEETEAKNRLFAASPMDSKGFRGFFIYV
jgi:hypothetical protein